MTRILIISAGGTPQVVTETLHALLDCDPRWLPDRILLATTSHGASLYEGRGTKGCPPPLLGRNGRCRALYDHFGLADSAVEPELLVARLPSGDSIADLRTHEEFLAFADLLLSAVGEFTGDKKSEIHLSLAGGRKTMSFLAGQVMSLYGRHQDVMSHVLVEPVAIENNPTFWWPGQPDPVFDRSGKPIDISGCRVALLPIPFVKLRPWLEVNEVFPDGAVSYARAVERANAALAVDGVTVDLSARLLQVGGSAIQLAPQHIAPVALVALATRNRWRIGWRARNIAINGNSEAGVFVLAWLRSAANLGTIYEGDASAAELGFAPFDAAISTLIGGSHGQDDFASPKSHVRGAIRNIVPSRTCERVLPRSISATMDFPRERIRVLIPPELADHSGRPAGTEIVSKSKGKRAADRTERLHA